MIGHSNAGKTWIKQLLHILFKVYPLNIKNPSVEADVANAGIIAFSEA